MDLWVWNLLSYGGGYSELCQASNMELSAKIVNGWNLLTIFAKRSILDVWQGSKYASTIEIVTGGR